MSDISALQAKVAAAKAALAEAQAELHIAQGRTPGVSPLAPAGFPELPAIDGVRIATGEAGVKYKNRTDVMLAVAQAGSSLAGVFTRSATRSANVRDCQAKLAGVALDQPIAILVNSGNSNAFTGERGEKDVHELCMECASVVHTVPGNVFTSSTGVIGQPLPADRIIAKMPDLVAGLAPGGFDIAARAIMTTDTYAKGASRKITLSGQTVTINGIAKGSGMIAPDMATMLVYIFTDARITPALLQAAVSACNGRSFNRITVDSDTSTSDTLLAIATNQNGPEITDENDSRFIDFAECLEGVMLDLAHQVVRDGEGATKFVSVTVTGAATPNEAQTAALAIANSPLVKTAIAGEDPNWGRIVMAIGKAGVQAERDLITIHFGDILVAENGWVSPDYREEDGAAYFKQENLDIRVDLGLGTGEVTVWTCDLTHEYISINADYRS
jgi:glutamate N-acetyltransferase/amino-acid N-acetyltransferase